MKTWIASLVMILSCSVWVVGVWIIFCLGLVFLVEPPKHFIWRNVLALSSCWLASLSVYWILYYTDFWGGRSLIETWQSGYRQWFIHKRETSKTFRILLGIGSICLLLRMAIDFFHLAKP